MPDYISGERALRQEINELKRQIRQLGTATIQNSSIGRAGIRVYDGGVITIENGGLRVIGWIDVDGEIRVAGTLRGTGELVWTGKITASGQTDLTGPTKVTGAFTVDGLTKLLKTLTVEGGGKIQVGTAMTLDPTVSSGAIVFGNGSQIFTNSSTIQVYKGNGVVQISDSEAKLQFGGAAVVVDGNGVRMSGLPVMSRTSIAGNPPVGCIWSNPSGQLYRVVA